MASNFIIIRVDNSGSEASQGEIAAPVDRNVLYLFTGDCGTPLGALSLKLLSTRNDGHIFTNCTDLKLDIRCRDLIIGTENQTFQVIALEPSCFNPQPVSVRLQLWEDIAPVLSRLRGACFVAAGARHLDFCPAYRRPLRILNVSRKRPAGCLSRDRHGSCYQYGQS